MNRLTLTLLISILVLSTSFQIKNINHDLLIENSSQYVQYIQTLSGLATQNDLKNNQKLSQIVQDERISFLNPQSDIVLALVDEIKQNNENLPTLQDLNILNELDTLINEFNIVNLGKLDSESLMQKVKEFKMTGKTVHTLEISPELLQQLQTHTSRKLEQTDSEESSNQEEQESSESVYDAPENTVHKQQAVQAVKADKANPTYILKFFFAFIFIIVTLGSLMAIANMQNKKDTLLYAKFIADVGAR